jgi:hypothetical protein
MWLTFQTATGACAHGSDCVVDDSLARPLC